MRVGFIGLGSQGAPMAQRQIECGVDTLLWARREATLAPFRDSGAEFADSAAELARACELVSVCVLDDAGAEDVLCGEQGVLAGIREGQVVALHSTVHPETVTMLAAETSKRGATLSDVPVSGGAAAALTGDLVVMVGGERESFERCQPVFSTYGKPVIHVGPLGTAVVAKLVNNAMMTAQLGLACDAFALGEKFGVKHAALAEVLTSSSGNSFALGAYARMGGIEPMKAVAAPLLRKDLGILDELARERNADPGAIVDTADRALAVLGNPREKR